MKPVRTRPAQRRRSRATRGPRGFRAQVMVRSDFGHWTLASQTSSSTSPDAADPELSGASRTGAAESP